MIVDNILDAQDGVYDAKAFYYYAMDSERIFETEDFPISRAFDGGTNEDVIKVLCEYIDNNGYNPEIKTFIKSFTWVTQ